MREREIVVKLQVLTRRHVRAQSLHTTILDCAAIDFVTLGVLLVTFLYQWFFLFVLFSLAILIHNGLLCFV